VTPQSVSRTIAVCPACRYCWLTDGSERTDCGNCGAGYQLAAVAATPTGAIADREEGRALLGVVRARVRSLRPDERPGTFDVNQLRSELNTTIGFETPERQPSGSEGGSSSRQERSDHDIVLDGVDNWACPKKDAVLSYTSEAGLSRDVATGMLERLHRNGKIVSKHGFAPGVSAYYRVVTRSRYRYHEPDEEGANGGAGS